MSFLDKPNLPDKAVTGVIISPDAPEKAVKKLRGYGINVYFAAKRTNFPIGIRGHADLQIFHAGGNIFAADSDLKKHYCFLEEAGADLSCGPACKPGYLTETLYNAASNGSDIFCNEKTAYSRIATYGNIIHINQGYSKCSICFVDDRSIITSDSGIYKTAKREGYDALLINNGFFQLEGYKYGFIGGASGKIDKDTLAFCGEIHLHPDYDKIAQFAGSRHISLVELCEGACIDIGGIIPVTQ